MVGSTTGSSRPEPLSSWAAGMPLVKVVAIMVVSVVLILALDYLANGPPVRNTPAEAAEVATELRSADPGDFIILNRGGVMLVMQGTSRDNDRFLGIRHPNHEIEAIKIDTYSRFTKEVVKPDDPRWPELAKQMLGIHP